MQEINLNMDVINTLGIYEKQTLTGVDNIAIFNNILKQKNFKQVLDKTEKFLKSKTIIAPKWEIETIYIVVAKMLKLIEKKGEKKRENYIERLENFIKNNLRNEEIKDFLLNKNKIYLQGNPKNIPQRGTFTSMTLQNTVYNNGLGLYIDIIGTLQNNQTFLDNTVSSINQKSKEQIDSFINFFKEKQFNAFDNLQIVKVSEYQQIQTQRGRMFQSIARNSTSTTSTSSSENEEENKMKEAESEKESEQSENDYTSETESKSSNHSVSSISSSESYSSTHSSTSTSSSKSEEENEMKEKEESKQFENLLTYEINSEELDDIRVVPPSNFSIIQKDCSTNSSENKEEKEMKEEMKEEIIEIQIEERETQIIYLEFETFKQVEQELNNTLQNQEEAELTNVENADTLLRQTLQGNTGNMINLFESLNPENK